MATTTRKTTARSLALLSAFLLITVAADADAQEWRPRSSVDTVVYQSHQDASAVTPASVAVQAPQVLPSTPTPLRPAGNLVWKQYQGDAGRISHSEPAHHMRDNAVVPAQGMELPFPDATQDEGLSANPDIGLPNGMTTDENGAPIDDPFDNPVSVYDLTCDQRSEQFLVTPLDELSHTITPKEGKLPDVCMVDSEPIGEQTWASTTVAWNASALCHKPAYFETEQLSRYGHTIGPIGQPIASAAHFFLTVPILPYKMGLQPPGECVYSLGYYRPDSCAPYIIPPVPLSLRGGLFQAGAVTGAVFALP
jgi:hypothetical protein